jgi:hypothetical protein
MHSPINDTKEYTLLEIVELGVLGKSHHTVSSAILRDKIGDDILKAEIIGKGTGVRYRVLGHNLKRYLERSSQDK